MNWSGTLAAADSRAAFAHGWDDFTPTGLLIARDGTVSALAGLPAQAGVAEMIVATGRAARKGFAGLAGIGVAVSAWSSALAVQHGMAPSNAQDRRRTRIIYAADTDAMVHRHVNAQGECSYEQMPAAQSSPIGEMLAQALAEATFTAALLCSTGQHERKLLL